MGSTAARSANPGLGKRMSHNVANCRRTRQSDTGRYESHEDPPRCADARVFAKIVCQSFSNIREKRQMVHHPAFSTDNDLANPPANIIKFERYDFSSAQTEPGKQEQNRVISAAAGC
jgi:hypothetical protein